MAQGFGVVEQAVKCIETVRGYVGVGMEIANEVAMDFIENDKDKGEDHIKEFGKVMLEFVKMERDLHQFQEAVDYVKQTADTGETVDLKVDLESMLDKRLADLRKSNNDSVLQEHTKMQEFNDRMWSTINPDDILPRQARQAGPSDEDIEMTQQTVNTKCPYTGKEMVVPVTNTVCNHIYDRDGIMEYVKKKKNKARCPLIGCPNQKPIKASDLEENKELRRYIERKNRHKSKK